MEMESSPANTSRFLVVRRNLLLQKKESNPGDFIVGLTAQEAVDIMWAGQVSRMSIHE